jgi:hypothetical protein
MNPAPGPFLCRVCNRRIRRKIVEAALARGKTPAYCGPKHKNTYKSRVRRARRALEAS